MSKTCKDYEKQLIDIFYEEETMNDDVKNHLMECQNCKKYWEELNVIRVELDNAYDEVPIEYMKITQAFDNVKEIELRRSNIFSLIIFIIMGGLLLGIGATLIMQGYVKSIIYLQVISHICIPIIIPVFIKLRYIKEGYNE